MELFAFLFEIPFIIMSEVLFGTIVFAFLACYMIPDRWERNSSRLEGTAILASIIVVGLVGFVAWDSFAREHAGGGVWTFLTSFISNALDVDNYIALLKNFYIYVIGYVVAGVAWSIAYLGLYSSRLDNSYATLRDEWMRNAGIDDLSSISPEQKEDFMKRVVQPVKNEMLYTGSFPLNPIEQKRFFIANATLFPLSIIDYFFSAFLTDVAVFVWKRVRRIGEKIWEIRMSELVEDRKIARKYIIS